MSFDLLIHKTPPATRSPQMVAEALALVKALPKARAQGEIHGGPGEPCAIDEFYVDDLSAGERKEFAAFCEARGLKPKSQQAAAAFVDHQLGPMLVSLNLGPADDNDFAAFFAGLVALACKEGWRIDNPQTGACVDLENPGTLPAGY